MTSLVGACSLASKALTTAAAAAAARWYAAPGIQVTTDLLSMAHSRVAHRVGDCARPDRFTLSLEATKADQSATSHRR